MSGCQVPQVPQVLHGLVSGHRLTQRLLDSRHVEWAGTMKREEGREDDSTDRSRDENDGVGTLGVGCRYTWCRYTLDHDGGASGGVSPSRKIEGRYEYGNKQETLLTRSNAVQMSQMSPMSQMSLMSLMTSPNEDTAERHLSPLSFLLAPFSLLLSPCSFLLGSFHPFEHRTGNRRTGDGLATSMSVMLIQSATLYLSLVPSESTWRARRNPRRPIRPMKRNALAQPHTRPCFDWMDLNCVRSVTGVPPVPFMSLASRWQMHNLSVQAEKRCRTR